jgi:hypothetical protein
MAFSGRFSEAKSGSVCFNFQPRPRGWNDRRLPCLRLLISSLSRTSATKFVPWLSPPPPPLPVSSISMLTVQTGWLETHVVVWPIIFRPLVGPSRVVEKRGLGSFPSLCLVQYLLSALDWTDTASNPLIFFDLFASRGVSSICLRLSQLRTVSNWLNNSNYLSIGLMVPPRCTWFCGYDPEYMSNWLLPPVYRLPQIIPWHENIPWQEKVSWLLSSYPRSPIIGRCP